jgi:hypothetical protein
MPLNIDLDSAYYNEGKFVISGQASAHQGFDAALMLTALRAACDAGDPYFSLDPDNGAAWSAEGAQAFERLWPQISADVGWRKAAPATLRTVREHSLFTRIIWARRDYPQLWNSIASGYPDLRSKLVFRLLWLQQTRFGEILYKADVLLKELASGVSMLTAGPLRAANVSGYVSQLDRHNANNLFASLHKESIATEWKGSRFWFDIVPRPAGALSAKSIPAIRSVYDRQLLATLIDHHLIANETQQPQPAINVLRNDYALDLSKLYPTMFVRRHDSARGVDLPDDDPTMNGLSNDINNHMERYVAQYGELQALTTIMRAYVAAVHITKGNILICRKIKGLARFESEKSREPLPAYQPSELIVSVSRYAYGADRTVNTLFVRSVLVQGGVTMAGKSFYAAAASSDSASAVIRSLNSEIAHHQEALWTNPDGRKFISFNIDSDSVVPTTMFNNPSTLR